MVADPPVLQAAATAQQAGEALDRPEVRALFVCDDGRLEERAADSLAAVAARDHQPEVRDVRARRVAVAADREAADDLARLRLRDERGRVGVPAERLQVAPLVADAAPAVRVRDQPSPGLAADRAAERD